MAGNKLSSNLCLDTEPDGVAASLEQIAQQAGNFAFARCACAMQLAQLHIDARLQTQVTL